MKSLYENKWPCFDEKYDTSYVFVDYFLVFYIFPCSSNYKRWRDDQEVRTFLTTYYSLTRTIVVNNAQVYQLLYHK